MFYDRYAYPDDLRYYARQAAEIIDTPDLDVSVTFHQTGDAEFGSRMRTAFEFLRLHGDGRYSNNSLMSLLNLAEGSDTRPPAFVMVAESPFHFDEETEVKQGGVLGMLVQTNNGVGRALLATAGGSRRRKVGKGLLYLHRTVLGSPSFWIHPSNTPAQHFLLDQGFQVMQMNSRGALRYSMPGDDNPEEE